MHSGAFDPECGSILAAPRHARFDLFPGMLNSAAAETSVRTGSASVSRDRARTRVIAARAARAFLQKSRLLYRRKKRNAGLLVD